MKKKEMSICMKSTALIDTNVVLDWLLEHEPFATQADEK